MKTLRKITLISIPLAFLFAGVGVADRKLLARLRGVAAEGQAPLVTPVEQGDSSFASHRPSMVGAVLVKHDFLRVPGLRGIFASPRWHVRVRIEYQDIAGNPINDDVTPFAFGRDALKIGPGFTFVFAGAIEPRKAGEGNQGPIVGDDHLRKTNLLMIAFRNEEGLHLENGLIVFLLSSLK